MDKASPYTGKDVMESIPNNRDIKWVWLPTAAPDVSAVEECRRRAKRYLSVSEYYSILEEMRKAPSEYVRTKRTDLDVTEHIAGKSV